MAIGDWFLARSEAFRFLLRKFKEHKYTTERAFYHAKKKDTELEKQIKKHDEELVKIRDGIEELKTMLIELPLFDKVKKIKK